MANCSMFGAAGEVTKATEAEARRRKARAALTAMPRGLAPNPKS